MDSWGPLVSVEVEHPCLRFGASRGYETELPWGPWVSRWGVCRGADGRRRPASKEVRGAPPGTWGSARYCWSATAQAKTARCATTQSYTPSTPACSPTPTAADMTGTMSSLLPPALLCPPRPCILHARAAVHGGGGLRGGGVDPRGQRAGWVQRGRLWGRSTRHESDVDRGTY